MKLTKNFYKSEFDSKDGSEMPDEVLEQVKLLAKNLQRLRDSLDCPIEINSGYRSPNHNSSVGGSPKSQHLLGKAADIDADDYTPYEVAAIIEDLIELGQISQGGVGIYNTFVHYDIRGTKARWNFSN